MGYDAVVVGSGPNGLAAAIRLAQAGLSVCVLEAADSPGGGVRTAELTLPGCLHDICSAVHPMAANSPFFRSLELERKGLCWITPPVAMAHPFDDGTAAALCRSVEETAATLGADGSAYLRLLEPLVRDWRHIEGTVLGPLRVPAQPLKLARFGWVAIKSAGSLAAGQFRGRTARGLWAGLAAHSMLPLESLFSSAIALVLSIQAHYVGWPFPRGGAGSISEVLVGHLRSLGGTVKTSHRVARLSDLQPSARAILFDLSPKPLLAVAGDSFPASYRHRLSRYRYGMGVFKLDLVIEGEIPFTASDCRRAGTVHLGATFEEIAEAERTVWEGRHPERPFVLLSQPGVFDPSRAPSGLQTVWAYCHVPNGSEIDMTEAIENQIERFAPGFRRRIIARRSMTSLDFERYNENYVGGDINGGTQDWTQLFSRPVLRFCPYSTPVASLFICSSSTPPGGGVHGMCGYHAANAALKRVFRRRL
jgi:phytoene dehydrogenase-like protein